MTTKIAINGFGRIYNEFNVGYCHGLLKRCLHFNAVAFLRDSSPRFHVRLLIRKMLQSE